MKLGNFPLGALILLLMPLSASAAPAAPGWVATRDEEAWWTSTSSEDDELNGAKRVEADPEEQETWLAQTLRRAETNEGLRAWEHIMTIQDFAVTGVEVPRKFDEAIRRILIALRRRLCYDVVDNDVRCLLSLESAVSGVLPMSALAERLALAATSPRALFSELMMEQLLLAQPLTGEVKLTAVADAAAEETHYVLQQYVTFERRPHFAAAACFNLPSCLPDYLI